MQDRTKCSTGRTSAARALFGKAAIRHALIGLLGSTALLAAAPAYARDLTIALSGNPTSMDPYYHNVPANNATISHILEPLIFAEAGDKMTPGLAESWSAIDDTTWEFKLRQGVTFHDGTDFTADDVIFSINRVGLVQSPAPLTYLTKGIAKVEAVDPHTVRIVTSAPDAELPAKLSLIAILSHTAAAGTAPEGKTTAELNAGNGLVGTGPYKFVSYVPNDKVVLTANADYWGKKPAWENVVIKVMTADPARTASVLAGEVDVAQIPQESVELAKKSDGVNVTQGETCQFVYLAMDNREPTPTITGTEGKNPLKDPRVRHALSAAIDRKALSDRILAGFAAPTAELGLPTLGGASVDAKPETVDQELAKKLLAEAGYPNGFGITLNGSSGLFPQDSQLSQAIASMWTKVGVTTQVDNAVGAQFYTRRNNGEYSSYVTHFCPTTGQLSYSLRLLAMTRDPDKGNGTVNWFGYSNPKVDELMMGANSSVDKAKRDELVHQASDIVMNQDHGVLSILGLQFVYAAKKELTFTPRLDAHVTAMQVEPATN
jgi:peptide/nickel transport system substrate-binding protein